MLLLLVPCTGLSSQGEVVYRVSGCDYFIVETYSGYAVLEWYGGSDPDKGDNLAGSFESYGMKTIFNTDRDTELRVWVEDYYLSKTSALEKLMDKCD